MPTKPKKTTEPKDLLTGFMKAALDRFETDPKLEHETGVDIDVDGVGTFTVLRATQRNPKFIKAYREIVLPYIQSQGKDYKFNEADPKLEELNRQLFAEVIIIGLKDAKGNKIDYDKKAKDAVQTVLKKSPDLYILLQDESVNAKNFRKHFEAEEKN